ncbi:hypothetical protein OF829_03825 [Sphingomonas sp. LB-2]|uniref:hypothetical protein n=1 Tax=Sphingomonas caeni TaxID=2984949 RepID=UPI00223099FE|nr:hypothetical protein [Sphingomonas caeni]MCW3846356.1 hypothetical protein [Sphingomonas caeni]
MRLIFTKGAGKMDRLEMIHADGRSEGLDCPKQRIIPHDMVHYAVESVLGARGFIARVAAGEVAALTMEGGRESDGVERLVEALQGDGWSGGTAPAEEVRDLYRVTCEARGCPMLPVDAAAIDAIRARIAELTAEWEAVPVGGAMEVEF